jgi:hypothetical protein
VDFRMSDEYATESPTSSGKRWRWVLLALVPGVLGDLIFASAVAVWLITRDVDAMMNTLWTAVGVPFVMPIYLYLLGRKYVHEMHGGLKSAVPFAILYCAPNVVLWLCGGLFAAFLLFPAR